MPARLSKIGKNKNAPKRWLWGVYLTLGLVITAGLGTSYNWVLVRNYNRMIELAKSKFNNPDLHLGGQPWLNIVLGSLGFLVVIFMFIVFFVKLLREMKLNQSQKEFLANVTHELKTPLSSLELSSQLIRRGNLSVAEQNDLWESHSAELERLKGDIDRLLTASRLEQFADKPALSPLNLEKWLNKQISSWEKIFSPQIEFKRAGPPLEIDIQADSKLLDVITRNIVDNAKKFNSSMPAKLTIETEVIRSKEPEYAVWSIKFSDNGMGFDPSKSADIFKRFKRLKTKSESAIPGAGLGMHLAHSAAKNMNFDLRAESLGEGKGATFILEGKEERLSNDS